MSSNMSSFNRSEWLSLGKPPLNAKRNTCRGNKEEIILIVC